MILSLQSKFSTGISRVVFIGTQHLSVYHVYKHDIADSYLFDTTVESLKFFRCYLNKIQHQPTYILLDTAAEEYRIDTIPHVLGADRKALIERKRTRLFTNTPYFYTEIQDREKHGRRDDKIMFSAITSLQSIQPWLKILEDTKTPIIGIASIPLLMQDIKTIIPNMRAQALVFSLQSISGLRQSLFLNRALTFSRLIKMPRYGSESCAPIITDELTKLTRYINDRNLIDESKQLDIYLIGDQRLLQELRATHTDSATLHYHWLDITVLSNHSGLMEQAKTPFSDKYLIHQILKYRNKNYYANRQQTHYFKMQRMNNLLRFASCVLIFIGVICTTINMLQGFVYRQQHTVEMHKVQFYNDRYASALTTIPALSIMPNDLKVAIEINNTLTTYKTDPIKMLKLISNLLERFPTININQLRWSVSTDSQHQLFTTQPASDTQTANQDTSATEHLAVTGTNYPYYQIALLDGDLEEFAGDYRQALATIEQFATALRQHVHTIDIINLPLDPASNVDLQGSTKQHAVPAHFSIRIVLGMKHEA